jgi:hypothetical protein
VYLHLDKRSAESLNVDVKCVGKFGSGMYLEFLCDSACNR